MLEISLQLLVEIKMNWFVGGRKSKSEFEYRTGDWISIAIVEKYLLNGLAIVIGSVKVALLSVVALGDV